MIYQVDNAELAREFEPDLTLERAIGFLNYYFFTLIARFGLTGRFGLSFGLFLNFSIACPNYSKCLYHYSGVSLFYIL